MKFNFPSESTFKLMLKRKTINKFLKNIFHAKLKKSKKNKQKYKFTNLNGLILYILHLKVLKKKINSEKLNFLIF